MSKKMRKNVKHRAIGRRTVCYSAWNNKTGELVCLDEPAPVAAKLMGIKENYLRGLLSRPMKKWTVEKNYYDALELEIE